MTPNGHRGAWPRGLRRFDAPTSTGLADVCQAYPSALVDAPTCSLDAVEEAGIVFEAVVEPVILRPEPDQYARRFAVERDQNIVVLGFT